MRFIQPNMKHQKSFHALGEGVPKGPGKLAGVGGCRRPHMVDRKH